MIARQLAAIFDYRRARIAALLPGDGAGSGTAPDGRSPCMRFRAMRTSVSAAGSARRSY